MNTLFFWRKKHQSTRATKTEVNSILKNVFVFSFLFFFLIIAEKKIQMASKKENTIKLYAHNYSTEHARDQRCRITDKQSECSLQQGTKLAIEMKKDTRKILKKKSAFFWVSGREGRGCRIGFENGQMLVFKIGLLLEFSVGSVWFGFWFACRCIHWLVVRALAAQKLIKKNLHHRAPNSDANSRCW